MTSAYGFLYYGSIRLFILGHTYIYGHTYDICLVGLIVQFSTQIHNVPACLSPSWAILIILRCDRVSISGVLGLIVM